MLKPRLIAVLLFKNGILVRSKQFSFHQFTGDPLGQVERFTAWKADELIYLDISRDNEYDVSNTMSVIGSTSSNKEIMSKKPDDFVDVIRHVATKCLIPLTVGGKIDSLEKISSFLRNGADKVSINTKALDDPGFIELAAKKFGSQCIVGSVDFKTNEKTGYKEVYKKFGKDSTGRDPLDWCLELERLGAGEIVLNSIDRDGMGEGYDIDLIKSVCKKVQIPVIALGGVGTFEHLVEGLKIGKATAVAAANIFHFTELSIINAKKHLKSAGIDVRL
jgi:imidazole glycerol-phosphate synthase subunit HisF